ncbi:MAG: penicillin-binding transpeptidase domain-containing protein [Candidatus Spyradocola sp.]|jgi:stage V sporulation protein D (sporulation-specific penicillin-binding protein)
MPNTPPTDKTKNRIGWLFSLVVLCFVVMVARLFYIQIIDGANLQSQALSQWTRSFTVTAKRGEIVDVNGKVLAQSASSVTITATPKDVVGNESEDPTTKETRIRSTAQTLAEILGLDAEEVYEKITDTDQNSVRLARQVKIELGDQVEKANLRGISVSEDTVRVYPMGAFLTQVLGFCTVSGEGQEGLEKSLDEYLRGKDGRIVTEIDAGARRMETGEEEYVMPENGYTVRLTVDYVIQSVMESVAEQALEETGAKGVQVVMMNVKTGEILGMVNKPDFDLNDPPRDDLTELAALMRNSCVQDAYEPGSTFKILTAALALENGVTSVDDTFYCKGYTMVDGDKISCWRTGNPHGSETLVDAVANSCNPVFVELALRMGIDTFYDGLHDFGIGMEVPIDLPGATSGQMIAYKYVKNVDIARVAFGQSVSVSPVQLLTACSAAVNGGELLKPHIVKEILTDEGEVVESYGKEVVGNPISEETSAIVRELLENAVENGGGRNAYIPGYRVGGKTGTAQKYVNGKVSNDLHICSFLGFAPMDDPEIGLLFIVDEPSVRPDYGSTVAAPYARQILEETLKYLGVEPEYEEGEEELVGSTVEVPNVTGGSVETASATMSNAGLRVMVSGLGGTIQGQLPAAGAEVPEGSLVVLYTEYVEPQDDGLVDVPDLTGMSLVPANRALRAVGLEMKIDGSGICVSQDPEPGERVPAGTEVTVTFD